MKHIKVSIKEKNVLELLEDAKKGDLINLEEITSIDFDFVNHKIEKEYKQRLDSEIVNSINKTKLEFQSEITSYKDKILLLNKDNENIKQITTKELENKYHLEINNLNNLIEGLRKELKEISISTKEKLENDFKEKINDLKEFQMKQIEQIEKDKNSLLLKQVEFNKEIELLRKEKVQIQELFELKLEKEINEKENQLVNKFNLEIAEKDKEISKLVNLRAIKNVKQTGEDLEAWCDLEVKTYMQNGFFNCEWTKDNIVVKNDEDVKGSKADFIFNIYTDDLKTILLSNICLEMKDENPDSINKKKNEDHYKQLDKNRTKKGCKYALLVSNLELDKPNDIPMYRVLEYPDMYVVRPAYLMTFLNMLVSITVKFKDLLLDVEMEKIEFKSSTELLEEFEKIKKTYLDNPLELLEREVNAIKTASSSIINSAEKINNLCENIKIKYIEEIENKLNRFNIKKIANKI